MPIQTHRIKSMAACLAFGLSAGAAQAQQAAAGADEAWRALALAQACQAPVGAAEQADLGALASAGVWLPGFESLSADPLKARAEAKARLGAARLEEQRAKNKAMADEGAAIRARVAADRGACAAAPAQARGVLSAASASGALAKARIALEAKAEGGMATAQAREQVEAAARARAEVSGMKLTVREGAPGEGAEPSKAVGIKPGPDGKVEHWALASGQALGAARGCKLPLAAGERQELEAIFSASLFFPRLDQAPSDPRALAAEMDRLTAIPTFRMEAQNTAMMVGLMASVAYGGKNSKESVERNCLGADADIHALLRAGQRSGATAKAKTVVAILEGARRMREAKAGK